MAVDLQTTEDKAVIDIDSFALQKWSPLGDEINREEFLSVSFSHHTEILDKTKDIHEVLFYIHQTVLHKWDKYDLRDRLKSGLYKQQQSATNNFIQTMPVANARKAIGMFKDEYLLDFINVEEMEVDKPADVDERVVEQAIVRNVKQFIMTFGRDFAYIGNQYHLEIFTNEMFPDLLFFQPRAQLYGLRGAEDRGFQTWVYWTTPHLYARTGLQGEETTRESHHWHSSLQECRQSFC